MSLTVIVSSDDVLLNQARDRHISSWTESIERIDLAEGEMTRLLDLLRSPSLFGTPRHGVVDHLEAFEGGIDLLEQYLAESDVVLVACWRGSIKAGPKKRLEALGSVESVLVPVKGDITSRIREMAGLAGVVLDGEGTAVLAERVGNNWGRVESVLDQLGASGLTHPTPAMLAVLCGSAGAAVAVWDVTDAVSGGRVDEAMRMAGLVEPVILSSWIGKETLNLARASEAGWSAEQASKELSIHAFRAKKLIAWTRRKRGQDWAAAIASAGRLDIAAKSGDGDRLLLALAEWGSSVT